MNKLAAGRVREILSLMRNNPHYIRTGFRLLKKAGFLRAAARFFDQGYVSGIDTMARILFLKGFLRDPEERKVTDPIVFRKELKEKFFSTPNVRRAYQEHYKIDQSIKKARDLVRAIKISAHRREPRVQEDMERRGNAILSMREREKIALGPLPKFRPDADWFEKVLSADESMFIKAMNYMGRMSRVMQYKYGEGVAEDFFQSYVTGSVIPGTKKKIREGEGFVFPYVIGREWSSDPKQFMRLMTGSLPPNDPHLRNIMVTFAKNELTQVFNRYIKNYKGKGEIASGAGGEEDEEGFRSYDDVAQPVTAPDVLLTGYQRDATGYLTKIYSIMNHRQRGEFLGWIRRQSVSNVNILVAYLAFWGNKKYSILADPHSVIPPMLVFFSERHRRQSEGGKQNTGYAWAPRTLSEGNAGVNWVFAELNQAAKRIVKLLIKERESYEGSGKPLPSFIQPLFRAEIAMLPKNAPEGAIKERGAPPKIFEYKGPASEGRRLNRKNEEDRKKWEQVQRAFGLKRAANFRKSLLKIAKENPSKRGRLLPILLEIYSL